MDRRLEELVRARARGVCEYCGMPSRFYDQPFHVDHVVARKHGGATVPENLAFARMDCNAHKGPNVAGIDPETGALTRLFNPRSDVWAEHFEWRGAFLIGRTAVGRVTVAVLEINRTIRVGARSVLIDEGIFPAV